MKGVTGATPSESSGRGKGSFGAIYRRRSRPSLRRFQLPISPLHTYGSGVTSQTDWVIMCSSTSVDRPGNVVVDQAAIGISSYSENIMGQLNVNYYEEEHWSWPYDGGHWSKGRRSDFSIHSVYIWDTELKPEQMRQVTRALRAQLGGKPNFQSSSVAPPRKAIHQMKKWKTVLGVYRVVLTRTRTYEVPMLVLAVHVTLGLTPGLLI